MEALQQIMLVIMIGVVPYPLSGNYDNMPSCNYAIEVGREEYDFFAQWRLQQDEADVRCIWMSWEEYEEEYPEVYRALQGASHLR